MKDVIDFETHRKRLRQARTTDEVKKSSEDITKAINDVSDMLAKNLDLFNQAVVNLAVDLQRKHMEADAILEKLKASQR